MIYVRPRVKAAHEQYPPDWCTLRSAVLARDEGCTGAGRHFGRLECHHIVHLRDGGTHDLSNLTTLCDQCHSRMHGWRNGPVIVRNRDGRIFAHRPVCETCGKATGTVQSVRLLAAVDRISMLCGSCRRLHREPIDLLG